MKILETDRLVLRHFTVDDSAFILRLVNEPSWLQYIGDRGVRTLDDARSYLVNGPIAMYARCGFGLYLTELKSDGTLIGLCGLVKRESLEDVDIGFAFLPEHWSKGYAYESAAGVLTYASSELGLQRVVAITTEDNIASLRLLDRLGLKLESTVTVNGEELMLLSISLDPKPA